MKKVFNVFSLLIVVLMMMGLVLTSCGGVGPVVGTPGADDFVFEGIVYDDGLSPILGQPEYWNYPVGGNGFSTGIIESDTYNGSLESLSIDWTLVTAGADGWSWNGYVLNIDSAVEDLSSYNALTFYAKADATSADMVVEKLGFGLDSDQEIYLRNTTLTTSWQKFILPIPDGAALSSVNNLFFATDGTGTLMHIDDIKFETLSGLSLVSIDYTGSDVTVNLGSTASFVNYINPGDVGMSQLTVTINDGTNDIDVIGKLEGYVTFSTGDPSIATVDAAGVITETTGAHGDSTTLLASVDGSTPVDIATIYINDPNAFDGVIYGDELNNLFSVVAGKGLSANPWWAEWTPQTDNAVTVLGGTGNSVYADFGGDAVNSAGVFFKHSGIDASAYTNLVFAIETTDFIANSIANFTIKIESTGQSDLLTSSVYASTNPEGNWYEFTIPLSAINNSDTSALISIGFIDPKIADGTFTESAMYLDAVRFE